MKNVRYRKVLLHFLLHPAFMHHMEGTEGHCHRARGRGYLSVVTKEFDKDGEIIEKICKQLLIKISLSDVPCFSFTERKT